MAVRGNPFGFLIVGAGAALIHLGMVVLLVSVFGWMPLHANVLAFCTAFVFGHYGHRRLSFDATAGFAQSFRRWGVVSVAGFGVNHSLYWASLSLFPQASYWLLLIVIMLLVALGTYCLGKIWAFSAT